MEGIYSTPIVKLLSINLLRYFSKDVSQPLDLACAARMSQKNELRWLGLDPAVAMRLDSVPDLGRLCGPDEHHATEAGPC